MTQLSMKLSHGAVEISQHSEGAVGLTIDFSRGDGAVLFFEAAETEFDAMRWRGRDFQFVRFPREMPQRVRIDLRAGVRRRAPWQVPSSDFHTLED
jgi:hypothetical protein